MIRLPQRARRARARRRRWPLGYIAIAVLIGVAALVAALVLGGGGKGGPAARLHAGAPDAA